MREKPMTVTEVAISVTELKQPNTGPIEAALVLNIHPPDRQSLKLPSLGRLQRDRIVLCGDDASRQPAFPCSIKIAVLARQRQKTGTFRLLLPDPESTFNLPNIAGVWLAGWPLA